MKTTTKITFDAKLGRKKSQVSILIRCDVAMCPTPFGVFSIADTLCADEVKITNMKVQTVKP